MGNIVILKFENFIVVELNFFFFFFFSIQLSKKRGAKSLQLDRLSSLKKHIEVAKKQTVHEKESSVSSTKS